MTTPQLAATQVEVYDTTLRDGTQQEGISLTAQDKLRVSRLLDDLGVAYIEGGWPGSNPKDVTFFDYDRTAETRDRDANIKRFDDILNARN